MNKVVIVLLAICLVYVHAFVKREAEPPKEQNALETAAKTLEQYAKEASAKVSQALDPEALKKGFNDLLDNLSKTINDLKSQNAKQ